MTDYVTDASDVLTIFDTDLTALQLAPFVTLANLVVTEELEGKGFSTARLTQIALWLSAHYAATLDPRVQRESVSGEYSVTYQGNTGMYLEATYYGQIAAQLDTSGTLVSSHLREPTFDVFEVE